MISPALLFALNDFRLGPKPKLQVTVCGASVFFPNFVTPGADRLLGAFGVQAPSQSSPEFVSPGFKPLIRCRVADPRGNSLGLFNLEFQLPWILILIH